MSAPLLHISGLSVRYGAARALDGVDIAVEAGECVAILGANGAGKSTLLKAIIGLVRPRAGEIAFAGASLAGLAPERRAKLGLGYAPEGRRPFGALTVRENLEVACPEPRRERARRIRAAYEMFPQLADKEGTRAWQLSGGQAQMLAVARAMMARPRLLLLDEPSLGLAARLVQEVMGRLARIAAEGTAVLLAEQNAAAALDVAARAYVLRTGRVALAGTAAELRGSAALEDAFLGG